MWCCATLFPVSPRTLQSPSSSRVVYDSFAKRVLWSGALTFRYGCTVHVGVDVGAGDAEVDVIYISFIMSVQYIGYLLPYKDKVQLNN